MPDKKIPHKVQEYLGSPEFSKDFISGIKEGFERTGEDFTAWLDAPSTLAYLLDRKRKKDADA